MKKIFLYRNWALLLLNFFVILSFTVGYGRFGDIIVDSFREVYIPLEMINGQALYKNIFNIYCPLAYMINALLFKIFGNSLNVIYSAGLVATLGIVNLFYIISKKFLDNLSSFAVVFCLICAAVLSPNVFNCFLPYSFGMLYGLLFVLFGLFFLLNREYVPAFLFYSLAVCCKYEFLMLLPLIIFVSWKDKKISHYIALISPMIAVFGILYYLGIRWNDLMTAAKITIMMCSAKTLYWFYSVSGLVFRPQLVPIYLYNFAKFIFPTIVYYFINKWFLIPLILVYCWFVVTPECLIFLYPLLLILFAYRYKALTFQEKIIVSASFLVSAKVFFALTIQSYGVYFLPFGLVCLLVLLPTKLKRTMAVILLVMGFCLGVKNIQSLSQKNVLLKTQVGSVRINPNYGISIKELVEYVQKNTQKNDRVVVYPECLALNVLAERKSDDKFYSLIPLYVETFGDDLIIKRIEFIKPEYIIISNYDTSVYFYSLFGVDYAENVYYYIFNNYEPVAQIGENLIFTVFKRKI